MPQRRNGVIALGTALLLLAAITLAVWSPSGSHVAAAASTPDAPAKLGPKDVLIGAYIDNIQNVDPQTNSFLADLYVWMRWTNKDLQPWKSMEFTNLYEAWQLMSWPSQDAPVRQPDGSWYYLTRFQGAFNSILSLRDYPFGTQQLEIEIEDMNSESHALRYVSDTTSVAISPEVSLPGFDIGEPKMAISEIDYATDFGSLDNTKDNVYSRATITTPVTHHIATNTFKYLVPIVLVMIAAGLIFLIPPGLVEGRIGLAITALLTLVAMQWTSTDRLPINSYLSLLDVLYLLSLTFILASLIQAIRVSWVARDENEAAAIRKDERSMKVFYAAYGLAFLGTIGYYWAF
ncbi:MAG: hypothetical protein WCN97_11990 [Thermoleophilia bacterium]